MKINGIKIRKLGNRARAGQTFVDRRKKSLRLACRKSRKQLETC